MHKSIISYLKRLFLLLSVVLGIFCVIPNSSVFAQIQTTIQDSTVLRDSLPTTILNDSLLEQHRTEVDYQYSVPEHERVNSGLLWIILNYLLELFLKLLPRGTVVSSFMLVILIALLVSAIILFIYLLYKNKSAAKQFNPGESVVPANFITKKELLQTDFKKLIEQSLAQDDYKTAVRSYYLLSLQKLALNKLITFKKTQTNYDYFLELKHIFKNDFLEICTVFEGIWYGGFEAQKHHIRTLNYFTDRLFENIAKTTDSNTNEEGGEDA